MSKFTKINRLVLVAYLFVDIWNDVWIIQNFTNL